MSIIIRLQNLPWAANALDIRQFFTGLQIPEGGVHIVGGELGDAFIAFSTDEDARQAFLRTDGKIKGIQIKLMLSSRTEMQRVIEQARTQSMAAFMLPTTQPVRPVQIVPIRPPLPAAVPQVIPAAVPEIQRENKVRDDSYPEKKRDRRRSRSKSRERRDRSRERRDRRYRDRSRSKSRDRRDRRRGRDRSRSRNRSRDKEGRVRRERPKSTDKPDDRERASSSQRDPKKAVSDNWPNNRPKIAPAAPSIILPTNSAKNSQGVLGPTPWGLNPPAQTNPIANMPPNLQTHGLNGFQTANIPTFSTGLGLSSPSPSLTRSRESWPPANPPSVRETYTGSPTDYSITPTFGNHFKSITDEVRGSRGDTRGVLTDPRVFRGEMSNMKGNSRVTKMDTIDLRDEHSRSPRDDFRTPKTDMRGSNNSRGETWGSKENITSFRNDGKDNLRADTSAIIRPPRPQDTPRTRENNKKSRFEDAGSTPVNACVALDPFYGSYGDLRRFFQGLNINYKGIKVINDEYGRKTGACFVQFRDAFNRDEAMKMSGRILNNTEVTIKQISDKAFQEAIDRYNPKMDDMNPYQDNLERTRNTKKFLSNEPDIKDFVCLKVEDLPTFVKEQDILHIFSQHPLISLHLNFKPKRGNVAYVQFSSKEVAKLAVEEKNHHMINGKPVTVKPCTIEEFNKVNLQKVEAFEEPKRNDIGTDCLSVANLPSKTNDRDISDFFSDIGVLPTKIHLMSNNFGFTGQAYCEFLSNEDAQKAVDKNNTFLGQNAISVESIPRAKMEAILNNTLPHPGTTPGQALPPGTPLPPIRPPSSLPIVTLPTPVPPEIVPSQPEKPVSPVTLIDEIELPTEDPHMEPSKEIPLDDPESAEFTKSNEDQEGLSYDQEVEPTKPATSPITMMKNHEDFDSRFDDFHNRHDENNFESILDNNSRVSFEATRAPFQEHRSTFESHKAEFEDHNIGTFESRMENFNNPRGQFNDPRLARGDFGHRGRGSGQRGENFRPREGNFNPHGEEFRIRGEEFRSRGEEFRPREEFHLREEEFRPRGEDFRSRGDEFRPRAEEFRPRGEGYRPRGRPREEEFRTHGEDFRPHGEDFRPHGEYFRSREEEFGPRDKGFGSREEFRPRGRDFGSRGGHRGSRFGPAGDRPPQTDIPVDDERPGCTVFMDNVPYKAGTNEILEFFEGYNCTNNVSRRYNANNTPSAEAKVTFYNPEDAYRAVRELNGRIIWDRKIFLRQE